MGWVPDSPDSDSPPVASTGKGKWVPDAGRPALPKGPTEMRAGHPYLETGEQIGKMAAFGGGALLGGPMGSAVAGTGDEVLNALINHYVSNRPINLSPSNIERSQVANTVGAYTGEATALPVKNLLSKAFGSIAGTTALGEGAKEAAAKGTTAEDEFNYARQQAVNEASKQIAGLHEKVAGQMGPESQQAQIASDIARTPAQTQAALVGNMERTPQGVSLPGPAMVRRQQDFYHSVYDPIHKMSEAGGDQYDKFWAPHLNDPVDSTPLAAAAAEEQTYAAEQGISYSPSVQKLLNRVDAVSGTNPYKRAIQIAPKTTYRATQAASPNIMLPTMSVSELRGLRSDASGLVASATSGRDKAAAQNIVEAVDATLDKSNILTPKEQQQLQGLNQKWRSYKTLFDRSLLRKIGSSAEPVDSASAIFDDPKRASLILANADRDQLSTLRHTYADWVNRDGSKVIKPEHAAVLSKLFPGTSLANPQSWLHMDAKLAKFQDVVNSSPQVRQRFMQEYQSQLHDIQTDSANQIVKAAIKQAGSMGTFGENLIKQIRGAKNPVDAANIATKGMTGLDTQSAIQAIQQGKMKGSGSLDWILRRWPFYAAFSLGSLAAGRNASPYMTGMAGLGAAAAGIGALRGRYLQYLADNPQAAQGFWNAINNAGTSSGFNRLARYAVQGAVSDAAAEVTKATTGTTLEPESAPGEGVKHLEQTRAEHLAPTPSAANRAIKVSKDISKEGKTPPDVHKDLNRGRLSMDETNKILQQSNRTDAMALVDGMPLSEMLDSVELAEPTERQMLLPLVKQRLMAELPKQQNKTLQANLAQRFQRLQQTPVQAQA